MTFGTSIAKSIDEVNFSEEMELPRNLEVTSNGNQI